MKLILGGSQSQTHSTQQSAIPHWSNLSNGLPDVHQLGSVRCTTFAIAHVGASRAMFCRAFLDSRLTGQSSETCGSLKNSGVHCFPAMQLPRCHRDPSAAPSVPSSLPCSWPRALAAGSQQQQAGTGHWQSLPDLCGGQEHTPLYLPLWSGGLACARWLR